MGTGYLKRADVLELFNSMGYDYIPSSTLLTSFLLFETKVEGLVNYNNMIEYIRENGISLACQNLGLQIYDTIAESVKDSLDRNGNVIISDKVIRNWYKKIDTFLKGSFTIGQLDTFLTNLEIPFDKETITALYVSMDTELLGVRLNNFATWLKSIHEAERESKLQYQLLSIREIQTKARAYLDIISKSNNTTLEEISSSFMIYDWKSPATGTITKSQFYRAVIRSGFPFTKNDCKLLQTEFSESSLVSYVRYNLYITLLVHSKPIVLTLI
jgi:hypothetical protein